MTGGQPIGPILDGLGVMIDLGDGALVEVALVVAKVVTPDGVVNVSLSDSAGMSWLDQLALVAAAQQIVNAQPFEHPDTG